MSEGSAGRGAPSQKATDRTRFDGKRGYIDFAQSHPLFTASYVGVLDLDLLVQFLEYSTDRFFSQKKKLAYVVDLTQLEGFGRLHRKTQAAWIARNRALIEEYAVGVCFAMSSRVQRGMLTAVFWLSQPGYPHKIFDTREGAIGWAVEQLRSAKVEVPQRDIEGALLAPY